MDEIQKPHDKFVKEFLEKTDNASSFLKEYLPENVLQYVDLDKIEPSKDSFIDENLTEYFADFLFQIGLKDKSVGYAYILFEHKSYQDGLTVFQLLKYMIRVWDTLLKNQKYEHFPLVIPFVLYHGKRQWPYGTSFKTHFKCPKDLEIYIPNFHYILWDLGQQPDNEIRGGILLKVFALLLKYIQRDEIDEKLPGIFNLLAELSEKKTAIEYLGVILRYLANAVSEEKVSFQDLDEMIRKSFLQRGGEVMGTIADMLRHEGLERGIQQGVELNLKDNVLKMYKKGVPADKIADLLEIDKDKVLVFIKEAKLV